MVDFSDLDTDLNAPGANGLTAEQIKQRTSIVNGGDAGYQQIKCPKCSGTGQLRYGYVNIKYYPCGLCKQTGEVTAKRIQRVEAAKQGRETAARNLAQKTMDFIQANRDAVTFINDNQNFDFYRSMQDAIATYGSLTDNQLAAVHRGMAKAAERRAERAKPQGEVDISAIEALFATAKSNGLKKLKFRTDCIDISVAPQNGRNAGSLYVIHDGEYAGKITNGQFFKCSGTKETTLAEVQRIAADPAGVARLYGKQTGICCCCGRELTDEDSVAEGIGPICARKWGI